MNFHVLTLFPEMILRGLHTSIIGRAAQKELIAIDAVNIRDYTTDRHGKVDDYTYGGGAGMLMQAQPVFDAYQAVLSGIKARRAEQLKPVRTIYVTPQGRLFDQKMAGELAREEELIFLCGHYEGIDERVLEEVVTDYVSIGDYVLTGGELAAMVMIDAISRLVPGVLNNDTSAETESFHNDLLEYPQYSRPEIWHGKSVPKVLLSGNHSSIVKWRLEQSKERTSRVRPELYEKYCEKQSLIKSLSKDKRNNIHVMESLARGKGEILFWQGGNILVCDRDAATCMMLAEKAADVKGLMKKAPEDTRWFLVNQEFVKEGLSEQGLTVWGCCSQYLYTARESLPVKYKDIRRLTMSDLDYVSDRYVNDTREYVAERMQAGAMYGAFSEDRLVGFIGTHNEGSMGMLYVDEAYRRQGIAEALEAYCVNRSLEKSWVPYCQVIEGNEISARLQEKLGLYRAANFVWWLERR